MYPFFEGQYYEFDYETTSLWNVDSMIIGEHMRHLIDDEKEVYIYIIADEFFNYFYTLREDRKLKINTLLDNEHDG